MKRTIITSLIAAMAFATAATPVFAAKPKTNTISESKAKQIAVEDAGLKESQVTFTKVQLETDDGRLEYEIDFNKDQFEYDYEINAVTGDIISADKDVDDDYTAPAKETKKDKKSTKKAKTDTITEDQALDIALKDAGISKDQISYSEVHKDYDDGINKYEVEVHVGNKEYNYDIAVKGGKILEHEAEIDD